MIGNPTPHREPLSISCYLCGNPAPSGYPNTICRICDAKAVSLEGGPALHASDTILDPTKPPTYHVTDPTSGRRTLIVNVDIMGDYGTNPVFIEGKQCWRRYRFGGWVTMADPDGCTSIEEFYAIHGKTNPYEGAVTRLLGKARPGSDVKP